MSKNQCPCGSGKEYAQCCKLYHDGFIAAPTAESLMRARYSAYVLEKADYIIKTWEELARPPVIEFDKQIKWLGLEIEQVDFGSEFDDQGWVEFRAKFEIAGMKSEQYERSRFIKDGSEWFYDSMNSLEIHEDDD